MLLWSFQVLHKIQDVQTLTIVYLCGEREKERESRRDLIVRLSEGKNDYLEGLID